MANASNGSADAAAVLIFENDPRQAIAYQELFVGAGYKAQTALPDEAVQQLCEQLQPRAVLFDMGIWEADTAQVFGILNGAVGFERPVIIALGSLPHQVRRAKRFGADGIWVRGVDDAATLPGLVADLVEQRREGKLKPQTPLTPLCPPNRQPKIPHHLFNASSRVDIDRAGLMADASFSPANPLVTPSMWISSMKA